MPRADRSASLTLAACCALFIAAEGDPGPERRSGFPLVVKHSYMCDASAAVALDEGAFIAADDERNTLMIYRAGRSGRPLQTMAWDRYLGIDASQDEHPEADLEGATVLGGVIFWITSHGRNRDGKWRANRHRLFAVTVEKENDRYTTLPLGTARQDLIRRLVEDERMRKLGLAAAYAAGQKKSQRLAPKREGLNVEGLCAAADGKTLWIAFRNPRPEGKALIVPLQNPLAVVAEGAAPQFGDPIQLRLATQWEGEILALGIRSMEYSPQLAAYLIVAGPHDTAGPFAIYRWSGRREHPPQLLREATATLRSVKDFRPEALIVHADSHSIRLLSDDGTLPLRVDSPAECTEGKFADGWCQQKFLLDHGRKTFRSLRIEMPKP